MRLTRIHILPLVLCLGGCLEGRGAIDVQTYAVPLQGVDDVALSDGTILTLTTAQFVFEDVLFEEPSLAARWPSLVPIAHAHAGHDYSGAESGELKGRHTVDLAGETAALGSARLLEGSFASARMQWPADGPAAVLEGTVSPPDAGPLPFRFTISEDRTVLNMPFFAEIDSSDPPTTLHLQVDLARILGQSDWTTPDQDGDGVLTAADGALGTTVRFGVRTSAAYIWEIEQ